MEINKENKSDLRFEQEDDAVWVFSGDSHQGTEITHLIMSHIDDYNEDDVRIICHYAANEIDRLRAELAKATPEGFVLVPKESLKVALYWMDENIDAYHVPNYAFAELFEHKPILEKALEAQEQSHELD